MSGCSKVIHENQMSLVVAGGQDSTGNKLKSVEIIAIDIENLSTPLTWTVLGAVYSISGQLGLSFSYVVDSFPSWMFWSWAEISCSAQMAHKLV